MLVRAGARLGRAWVQALWSTNRRDCTWLVAKWTFEVLCVALQGVAACAAGGMQYGSSPQRSAFSVGDYERVQYIRELAVSSDGTELAFALTPYIASGAQSTVKVYIAGAVPGSLPQHIAELDGASELQWEHGSKVLAALIARGRGAQVYAYDVRSRAVHVLATSPDPIVYFQYSDTGSLAYITRRAMPTTDTIYWRIFHGGSGFLADPETTILRDFYNPTWEQGFATLGGMGRLWVANPGRAAREMPVPGGVQAFRWGPLSRNIAVTYVANDVPKVGPPFQAAETSVGLVSTSDGKFRVVGRGTAAGRDRPAIWYTGGDWTENGGGLVLVRVVEKNIWYSHHYPDWKLVDVNKDVAGAGGGWSPIQTAYSGAGGGSSVAGRPVGPHSVLVETAVDGRLNLWAFPRGGKPRSVIEFPGDASEFAFTQGGTVRAFVGQTLVKPPEVYVVGKDRVPVRVTAINQDALQRIRYRGLQVQWLGGDAVPISGQLLEPKDAKKPWPLLVFVHGGPGVPLTDGFSTYFAAWPYPFEALASHGVAIFEPNYRGTLGYGRNFEPKNLAGAPALDIILGIQHLEEMGVADSKRIAICGQSHGGWLGPLVMEKRNGFIAASFAEGTADQIGEYLAMSGMANRKIHDQVFGAAYYSDPSVYLEDSPDLHLEGVSTPMLAETGAWSSPEFGLDLTKAARHFGAPAEWVVYPRTGHNIDDPSLVREAANRNFAWFEFWLRGENPSGEVPASEAKLWKRWKAGSQLARDTQMSVSGKDH